MNILLLSCKTGGGHDAAANALKEQFELMGHQAYVFDYLTLAGEKVAKRVANAYVKTVQKVPYIFGLVYKLGMFVSKKTRNSPVYIVNQKMSKYLEKYFEENHYDVVVMTHLYPAETLTYMRRMNIKVPPFYGVLTDYTLIPFWEETNCDGYIIPHSSLISECMKRGISREKLHPLGIPFSPTILNVVPKSEAKARLSLDMNKKSILIMGGSMGAGSIVKLAKSFAKCEQLDNLQIQIVCGSNKKVYAKLMKKYVNHPSFKIIGYTKQVPSLMNAADLIYTKPGGLTSTEAAASRTALVLTDPIPGCENSNQDFFVNLKMAVTAKKSKDLVQIGLHLLEHPEKAKTMIEAQKENIKEKTTENIANYILGELQTSNI
jgi:UDP-N-acetylglucosamine 2-epimerase